MDRSRKIEEQDLRGYFERICFKPVVTDPDAVYAKIWHRINYEKVITIGVSPVWKYFSVAVSVALLIVSSLFLLIPDEKTAVAYLEVKAVAGGKTCLVLPDSSVVWLNGKAEIRYPQQFTAHSREVELSGEAFFNVKKDMNKPFIVNIDGMRVQVLGTAFNIHTSLDSDVIETTLQEGRVAIFSSGNNTSVADQILKPNEQALFNRKNGELTVCPVHTHLYTSWVDGVFHFENNTLQEIFNTLERAFDTQIHIESEGLKKKRFTAQFTNQETLDEILSVLRISAKYKYKKMKGEVYITD